MKKSEAIALLGGSVSEAAKAIGINPQAVTQWPEELPARIADRVVAALARRILPPAMLGAAPVAKEPS